MQFVLIGWIVLLAILGAWIGSKALTNRGIKPIIGVVLGALVGIILSLISAAIVLGLLLRIAFSTG